MKVRTSDGEVDFSRLAALFDQAGAQAKRRPKVQEVVSWRRPGNGGVVRVIGERMDGVREQGVSFNGRPVPVEVTPEHVELNLPHGPGEPPPVSGELVLETVDGDRLRILLEEALEDDG